VAKDSPLTVAGAATASGLKALTVFPFDPRKEPSRGAYAGHEAGTIGVSEGSPQPPANPGDCCKKGGVDKL